MHRITEKIYINKLSIIILLRVNVFIKKIRLRGG